jgi:glycosyltransferase involved in cell wall biosynthesis
MPNVLLEAAARGLPIVASNVGGVSELICEETGYLVDPFDSVAGYVDAIKQVLEHKDVAFARAAKALDVVKQRHSVEAFRNALASLADYWGIVDPVKTKTSKRKTNE